MVYDFFGVLFYGLLIAWIVMKIVNLCFVNKNKCKDQYIEIKKNVKNNKAFRIISKIIIGSSIIELIYWGVGIVFGIFFLGMSIFTLGGAAFGDTGADGSFYNASGSGLVYYFFIAELMAYYIWAIIYLIFLKGIYFNFECYKKLKNIENDETKAGE